MNRRTVRYYRQNAGGICENQLTFPATHDKVQKENKHKEEPSVKHIQTIETRNLCQSAKNGGCGECQTSCQSACKTSSGIANQKCENKNK